MRFFIALEIPSENLAQFQAIQAKLHTLIPQAGLTDLDKIHLTLAFLGEQPDQLKDKLVQIIQKAVEGMSSFEVTPAYIDGFPNIHHPNILWVGVKGDIDKVLLIREYIKDGLASLHLPVDARRFVPHISIAKFSSEFSVDRNLEANLEKIMTENLTPIQISSIKLFESVLNKGFHKHNALAEIKLQ
ncbi:2'-5' RNA ligase [Candidatus Daviesbacteria bacterium RIFCSPLOWO2_01_FULL_39_12]|uniref:RNA 2',3'-cyclic phosphodiesterase n=1 Tax=Candidatus Daviesbacteria bacterium RIFCSPLOWO2_01_FULL_39_12 TaxID=1797785 RepID=A0A1F5KSH1_9BACT|nr:MAG: 2'-5' RNA ligase [Candidatus Daviesbacteria bacterium RIFCSPLOWO2_01_FULL_39_12]